MSDNDDLSKVVDGGTALSHEGAVLVDAAILSSGYDPAGVFLEERTPIKNQRSVGDCAPCAVTTAIEHVYGQVFSETFVFDNVKADRGDDSDGALIGEVAKSIQRHGICRAELYGAKELAEQDAALRIPVIVPFLQPGERAAAEAIEHLRAGRKIPVGFPIARELLEYRPIGRWDVPSIFASTKVFDAPAHIINDHAACLVGWRAKDGAYLIQSSWGTGWGMGGYAWFSRKYITMWGTAGFCYVVKPGE